MFGNSAAKKYIELNKIIPPRIINDCFWRYRHDDYHYTGYLEYKTCKCCGHTKSFYPRLPLPKIWRLVGEIAWEIDRLRDVYLATKKATKLLMEESKCLVKKC